MAIEQDVEELVTRGEYIQVKALTTADFCPHATRTQSETLVKAAASNRIKIIENQARRARTFQAFADSAKELVSLAKSGAFPFRVEAGEAAIKLYSERMATDQIRRLTWNQSLPKPVTAMARRELRTCQLNAEFLVSRANTVGLPQIPRRRAAISARL